MLFQKQKEQHKIHLKKNCRLYVKLILSLLYNRMMGNIEYGRDILKDTVWKEATQEKVETEEQEEKKTKGDVDLRATENARTLKGL